MSSSTDIGGFFATLGLVVDKNSFETGNKSIDGAVNKLTSLAGTVRNVSAILGAYAVATGKIEAAELRNAAALGIEVEKLNQWKTAAKLAGVSANGLVDAMSKLESSYQDLKMGRADIGLAEDLAQLGLNYNDVADMGADERLAVVLKTAATMDDQGKAARLLQKVLGQTGLDFYESMKQSNVTLDAILSKAARINVTDRQDYNNANAFNNEIDESKARLEAFSKLFGSELGKELTPVISQFNSFLDEHGDEIVTSIKTISKVVGKIAEKLKVPGEVLGETAIETVTNMAEGASMMLDGDISEGFSKAFEVTDKTQLQNDITNGLNYYRALGMFGKADYSKISEWDKNQLARWYGMYGDVGRFPVKNVDYNDLEKRTNKKVNDGIIRPNGEITQVAPDDWVFAARNVSDLASAFVPQAAGGISAPTQYTITQTFNINGAGNTLPQTIRQQAYKGTQAAIEQSISDSARRMQLMPGLN
jgi:hypothetical protein